MNIKLNNLIRRFMTLAYIVAALTGFTIGLIPLNLWCILLAPLYTGCFILLAYFLNIWVEHRYVTYPYERNVQVTLDANKVLIEEIEGLKKEIKEYQALITADRGRRLKSAMELKEEINALRQKEYHLEEQIQKLKNSKN